jgi:hypothetical protein
MSRVWKGDRLDWGGVWRETGLGRGWERDRTGEGLGERLDWGGVVQREKKKQLEGRKLLMDYGWRGAL